MNPNEEPIVPNPGEPVVVTSGEPVAENYVHTQLAKERKSLQTTRIATVVVVAAVGLYVGYLTQTFRANLEPRTAATITKGIVTERLNDVEPQVSSYIHDELPKFIRQAPDYAIAQLPKYRESIEDRVETDLRSYAKENSDKLTKELNTFLEAHKDQVEGMIQAGQDPKGANEMGDQIEEQFRTFLTEQPVAGDTLQARLDNTLDALNRVQTRTAYLAANKGLTPAEKKTRHAIALLMRKINAAPNDVPKIDLSQVSLSNGVASTEAPADEAPTPRAMAPKGKAPNGTPPMAPAPKGKAPKGMPPMAPASERPVPKTQ